MSEFIKGYACAIATMVRLEGETTPIREAYAAGCGSMTVADLIIYGVDESDIEVIKPLIKEIKRRRKI